MTTDRERSIIWHGMFLFLLGLLTGLAQMHFTNPRMGLAAHLEGLMNGTFLIALGAIWRHIRLPSGLSAGLYWSALYGAYVNWAMTCFAGAAGTNSMTPLAGAGFGAASWKELIVTLGFISVGIAMLAAAILALWGLRRLSAP
jgi:(hydroxyamino)benzene mutase